jgi:hypothetical protein
LVVEGEEIDDKKPGVTGEWEVDTFYSPAPVSEKGRPYYPKVCLIIDRQSSLILSYEMVEDIWKDGRRFLDKLVSVIERGGQIPAKILVARDETYCLLGETCRQLGIDLQRVARLESMERARSEMMSFFTRQ